MERNRLDDDQKKTVESTLRGLMLDYRNTTDEKLRARIRKHVLKTMDYCDVQPLGYPGLPYWMKE